MKRRKFLSKTGCGVAGMIAAPIVLGAENSSLPQERKRYKIEIEIYEAEEGACFLKKGDKFNYPEDIGKLCPWFLMSMHDPLRLLQHGVTLPWKYEGTPYEKVIDPNGITTEYIRCPDPTANLCAKIIRTRV